MRGASLAVLAAAALSLPGPAAAHPAGTVPIAAGESGPYVYEVAVGPYSPLRADLLVAVTLAEGDAPVIDADVVVTARAAGPGGAVGPEAALNAPDHPSTYEVDIALPRPPGRQVSLTVSVVGRAGRAELEATLLLPGGADPASGGAGPAGPGGWGASHAALAAVAAAAVVLAAWGVSRRLGR